MLPTRGSSPALRGTSAGRAPWHPPPVPWATTPLPRVWSAPNAPQGATGVPWLPPTPVAGVGGLQQLGPSALPSLSRQPVTSASCVKSTLAQPSRNLSLVVVSVVCVCACVPVCLCACVPGCLCVCVPVCFCLFYSAAAPAPPGSFAWLGRCPHKTPPAHQVSSVPLVAPGTGCSRLLGCTSTLPLGPLCGPAW